MPVLHEGQHICSQCRSAFEWVHHEPIRQELSSRMEVDCIPTNPMVHSCDTLGPGRFKMGINCPHCGFYNQFEFLEATIFD